jgi:hypothetical protein
MAIAGEDTHTDRRRNRNPQRPLSPSANIAKFELPTHIRSAIT